mmetsp:Transcript_38836/g.123473  ORF Transcript_38836/g.123473 Transcript_38836/m.123473 type:complete len:335 (-) Transcript_38836:2135-3139(-)
MRPEVMKPSTRSASPAGISTCCQRFTALDITSRSSRARRSSCMNRDQRRNADALSRARWRSSARSMTSVCRRAVRSDVCHPEKARDMVRWMVLSSARSRSAYCLPRSLVRSFHRAKPSRRRLPVMSTAALRRSPSRRSTSPRTLPAHAAKATAKERCCIRMTTARAVSRAVRRAVAWYFHPANAEARRPCSHLPTDALTAARWCLSCSMRTRHPRKAALRCAFLSRRSAPSATSARRLASRWMPSHPEKAAAAATLRMRARQRAITTSWWRQTATCSLHPSKAQARSRIRIRCRQRNTRAAWFFCRRAWSHHAVKARDRVRLSMRPRDLTTSAR